MELGDKTLRVQRASIGITQVSGVEMGVNAMSMLAGTTSTDSDLSRVLQLLNMVTPEELLDNDDYEGIFLLFFLITTLSAPCLLFHPPLMCNPHVPSPLIGILHEKSETS